MLKTILTPPPQNVTSGCHLCLSNFSKFSSNIKFPAQIARDAAKPLAVVIVGLQPVELGYMNRSAIKIIATIKQMLNRTIQVILSILFFFRSKNNILFFQHTNRTDEHWVSRLLNIHGWNGSCICVTLSTGCVLFIHKQKTLEYLPGDYDCTAHFNNSQSKSFGVLYTINRRGSHFNTIITESNLHGLCVCVTRYFNYYCIHRLPDAAIFFLIFANNRLNIKMK